MMNATAKQATAAEVEEALELVGAGHEAHLESVAGVFAAAGLNIVTPEKRRVSRARLVGQMRERLSSASVERVAAVKATAEALLAAARLLRWPVRDAMLDMAPIASEASDTPDEGDEATLPVDLTEGARGNLHECAAEVLADAKFGGPSGIFRCEITFPQVGPDGINLDCHRKFFSCVLKRPAGLVPFTNALAELCALVESESADTVADVAAILAQFRQQSPAFLNAERMGLERGTDHARVFAETTRSPAPEPEAESDDDAGDDPLAGIVPAARAHLFDDSAEHVAEDRKRCDWLPDYDIVRVDICIPFCEGGALREGDEQIYTHHVAAPRGSLVKIINGVDAAVARAARGGVTAAAQQESGDDE